MKHASRLARTLVATVLSLLLIVSFAPAAFAAEGAASADASLTALDSSQTLSPAFSPSAFAYTISLPVSTDSVTLTPAAAAGATFTMNGEAVASKTYTLGSGESTTATVLVTAEDTTTTATYTVAITRAAPLPPSADAALTALASTVALSPAFAASTLSYAVSLPVSMNNVTLTPAAAAAATFTMNGEAVASKTYTLGFGESTTATIVVTAEDGATTTTYTVAISRAIPDASRLLSPGISAGMLNVPFDPCRLVYTLTLPEGTPSVTFTPVKASPLASMYINSVRRASYTISLKNGQTKYVYVKVVSPAHVQRIYNFKVVRAKSTNADLKLLGVNVAPGISPAFNPATLAYTMTVSEYRHSVVVKATAAGPYATVYINGRRGPARLIDIRHSVPKTVTITVKAQAGNTKTYTITMAQAPHIRSFYADPRTVKPGTKPMQLRYTLEGASDSTVMEICAGGAWQQLMSRVDTAGAKKFSWDGTLGGTPVAPGTYKVRLSASFGGLAAAPKIITIIVK